MALFLASGDELGNMKNQVAAMIKEEQKAGAIKPRFAQLDSESDSADSSSD
jgi:hypothetical protein